jgi:hypothetical protein
MEFDKNFFNKVFFSSKQLDRILISANKDLKIAGKSKEVEVTFKFSYDAFLKFCIYIVAQRGYKIRSFSGHHQKIIEQTAEILNNKSIYNIGNEIRKKRNFDLYECLFTVSDKDTKEYFEFIKNLFVKYIKKT